MRRLRARIYRGAHTSEKKEKGSTLYHDILGCVVRCKVNCYDENKRSVYKGIILYPDYEETHKKAFDNIKKMYRYKAIIHDRDVDENGELKKSHMHVVLKLDSTQPNKTIADNLGIRSNYVQSIVSLKGALDYLTHKYSQDKFQYNESELLRRFRDLR